MSTIFLALGSNVGNKKACIEQAMDFLHERVTNIVQAQLYQTKPWGYENQENFLNTVLQGETNLTPQELLTFIKTIEQKVGRVQRFRNGPREIDIDILFYNDLIYQDKTLQIPHPRIAERDFVLQPLVDIAPNFIHPQLQKTMQQLLEALPQDKRFVIHG